MCRPQKDPLRPLSQEERKLLEQLSRSLTMPADQVIHAKEVLAVADGHTFTDAAKPGRGAKAVMWWPSSLLASIEKDSLRWKRAMEAVLFSVTQPSRVNVSCENFAVLLIAGLMARPPGRWSRFNARCAVHQTDFPA